MIYEILQLGKTGAELALRDVQTDAEYLPSGRFVLIRDIRKALAGESFNYFLSGGGQPIKINGMSQNNYYSYLTLFNNFKKFGLPHGKGWINELPWVIDTLSILEDTFNIIEVWKMNRGDTGDISTREAGV